MMSFTPTQLAMLALALIAGWLLGLASHPGGRKWKTRYLAERDAHAAYQKEADARAVAASRDVDTRHTDAERRIAELERENARLRDAAPVTSQTIAPRAAASPAFTDRRQPYPDGRRRGWFDWSGRTPTNG